MPGRPDFTTPGTQGSGQTVAVQNRPQVQTIDNSQTGSVASGSSEQVEFYAPTGAVWKPMNMWIGVSADADATSGDHKMRLSPPGSTGWFVITGKNAYNGNVSFNRSYWVKANSQEPTTEDATLRAVQALRATENTPLTTEYRNQTDAAQDSNRHYEFMFLEEGY